MLGQNQPLTLSIRTCLGSLRAFQMIGKTSFNQELQEGIGPDRRFRLSEGKSGGQTKAGEVLFRRFMENIGHLFKTILEDLPSGFGKEHAGSAVLYSLDVLQPLPFRDKNPAFFGLSDFLDQGSQAFEIHDPRSHQLMAEESLELRLCQQIRGDRSRRQELVNQRPVDSRRVLTQPGPELQVGSCRVTDSRVLSPVSSFKNIRCVSTMLRR
jgi:hypothetical protein